MAYSYTVYAGNGSTTDYIVPFGYLKREDVHVYLNDAQLTINDFQWLTSANIRFNTAPTAGVAIRFQRLTDKVIPAVDFRDGSTLTETDLDLAVTQLLYICQEAYDALDGETAVAAKVKCEAILIEVQALYGKTKKEIDYFRKMWIDVSESPSSPGRGEYDFETGRLHLYVPAGPIGPQGPVGEQGPQGPAGVQGDQGPRGIQGPQGEQGLRGPEGQQGLMGPQGIQGPKGDTGDRGPVGPQGIQGSTGAQGPRGETGPIGPTGPQGPIGPTGERGPQGPEGPKGAVGDKGPLGDSSLPLVFGNFDIDADGYLQFEYYGQIDQSKIAINPTTGRLEVTI